MRRWGQSVGSSHVPLLDAQPAHAVQDLAYTVLLARTKDADADPPEGPFYAGEGLVQLGRAKSLQDELEIEHRRAGPGSYSRRIDTGRPGTDDDHLMVLRLGDTDGLLQGGQVVGVFQYVDAEYKKLIVFAAHD